MHRMTIALALLALLAGAATAGESPFTESAIHIGVVTRTSTPRWPSTPT